MDKNEPQTWNVTENRFRTILMFLRIGGVPINTKNASLLHTTYNALMAINAYAMYMGICTDIIIHRDDLKNFMKTFGILSASSTIYWADLNLRYIIQRNMLLQWYRIFMSRYYIQWLSGYVTTLHTKSNPNVRLQERISSCNGMCLWYVG
jgi:hypothetical protein